MSSTIDVLEIGNAPYRLTVEGYDEGYYSSFWQSENDYDIVLEFCEQYPPSEDASATIQAPSEPQHQVPFEVADKYLSEETQLFRVDDHEYAITWQQLDGDLNRIGFISTEPNVDLLTELYHESVQADLSSSEQEELEDFLSNY